MVIVDRKLAGMLPYRTIFLPSEHAIHRVIAELKPFQMVRFFWSSADLPVGNCIIRHKVGSTWCTDLNPPVEALSTAIGRHNRHAIRQADKLGDRVRIVINDGSAVQDFKTLYDDFCRSKRGVWPLTRRTYDGYVSVSDVAVAYIDDVAMCGHLVMRDLESGRVRVIFAASRRLDHENARVCANLNRKLHWHDMLRYKDEGFHTYDWGGIRKDMKGGISEFKRSFSGRAFPEHTYLCAGSPLAGRVLQALFETVTARGRYSSQGRSETDEESAPDDGRVPEGL